MDGFEDICSQIFSKNIPTDPKSYNLLLNDPIGNTKSKREKINEIMFEKFNSVGISLASKFVNSFLLTKLSSSLTMYSSSGFPDGIVVSLGQDLNSVTTLINRTPISPALISDFGGNQLTEYLESLMPSSTSLVNFNKMKENHCYVALDFKIESQKNIQSILKSNSFEVPEVLFNPKLIGSQCEPLHYMIYNSIKQKPKQFHDYLFRNIILEGGGSLFPGFSDRLKFELQKLDHEKMISIVAPPKRNNSIWIGGSILASLSTFHENLISKENYLEYGSTINGVYSNVEIVVSREDVIDLKKEIQNLISKEKFIDLKLYFN